MSALLRDILEVARDLSRSADAGGSVQYAFELMVDDDELAQAYKLLASLQERIQDELERDEDPDGCSSPSGHEWNQTAGQADEARVARDWANDRIYCVHCGADGDA